MEDASIIHCKNKVADREKNGNGIGQNKVADRIVQSKVEGIEIHLAKAG